MSLESDYPRQSCWAALRVRIPIHGDGDRIMNLIWQRGQYHLCSERMVRGLPSVARFAAR
jgi:hypothetical protein